MEQQAPSDQHPSYCYKITCLDMPSEEWLPFGLSSETRTSPWEGVVNNSLERKLAYTRVIASRSHSVKNDLRLDADT